MCIRDSVADEELHEGGLAGAGRTHEEYEVPLGDHEIDVTQGDGPVRIPLRDIVQQQDRTIRAMALGAASQEAIPQRAGRRRGDGEGHVLLRG